MATLIWLKAMPPRTTPPGVRNVAIDIPPDLRKATGDFRTSTAYRALWDRYGSLPALLNAHAPGWTPPVGLVSFSAGLGLAEPLLRVSDLGVSVVFLIDSCFGQGTWPGYRLALQRALEGSACFSAVTGTTGGDDAFLPVWRAATASARVVPVSAPPGFPEPSRGAQGSGRALLLRYGPELPHHDMGKLVPAVGRLAGEQLLGHSPGPRGGSLAPLGWLALGGLGAALWWSRKRR